MAEYVQVQRDKPDEAVPFVSLQQAILAQLLPGLMHMRRRGIVHGDIQPANILVRDGRLCIAHFGAAAFVGRDHAGVGTAFYLPPDVFSLTHTHIPHFSWDLWATAITFYKALPGGLTEAGCHHLRYHSCQLPSGLPDVVSAFLRAMLQRDSNRRLTLDQAMAHPFLKGMAWAVPTLCLPARALT